MVYQQVENLMIYHFKGQDEICIALRHTFLFLIIQQNIMHNWCSCFNLCIKNNVKMRFRSAQDVMGGKMNCLAVKAQLSEGNTPRKNISLIINV